MGGIDAKAAIDVDDDATADVNDDEELNLEIAG
jgi:hypothetical protein